MDDRLCKNNPLPVYVPAPSRSNAAPGTVPRVCGTSRTWACSPRSGPNVGQRVSVDDEVRTVAWSRGRNKDSTSRLHSYPFNLYTPTPLTCGRKCMSRTTCPEKERIKLVNMLLVCTRFNYSNDSERRYDPCLGRQGGIIRERLGDLLSPLTDTTLSSV